MMIFGPAGMALYHSILRYSLDKKTLMIVNDPSSSCRVEPSIGTCF
jgi:hypothetical protein